MRSPRSLRLAALLFTTLVVTLPAPASAAGSGGWNPLGGGPGGTGAIPDKVYTVEAVGPVLYVGGQFEDAAGIAAADRIARWNGSAWSAVGAGIANGTVYAIAVDTATGRVYAGGSFANAGGDAQADAIAVWTGSAWSSLAGVSMNGTVFALEIVGRSLYVGGAFANANGSPAADGIASWNLDGGGWGTITSDSGDIGGTVSDLEADGSGGFYMSGNFIDVDGIPQADFVVRYLGGTSWGALGSGPGPKSGAIQSQPGIVRGLEVAGGDVYAVGDFIDAGGDDAADKIARWNGSSWSSVGSSSFFGEADAISLFDVVLDGPRPIVVGLFLNAGGLARADAVAAFVDGAWTNVGTNADGSNGPAIDLRDVAIVGSRLHVVGLTSAIGGSPKNAFVAWYRLRQPDATIAAGGTAVGRGVFNTTGASQTRSRSVNQGASGSFTIRVTNTGLGRDDFTVRGAGSGGGFTARYTVGATNVTGAIVGGTYRIDDLAPGATRTITLRVTVGGAVGNGARRSWLVRATSQGPGAAKDAVKAVVTAS